VSVALDLARQVIGGLSDHRVLVIGAGRMAELALKHLHGGATHSVTVINRTDERAVELAARYGVDAAPYATLEALLAEHDVVLSATASPEPIIDAAMVQRARANNDRQMILLDLAVPRDVSPDVALLPNVKLFDVDSMQAISAANRAARTAEVGVAEQLIQYEADKFMAWWSSQQVVPTIRALRERAEAIRTSELQRTLSRLSHLSPHEQEAIGALSAAIINKLLHQPIATLKDPRKGNELSAVVQQLFQL
jgi:glutamyl-tRNA reductase